MIIYLLLTGLGFFLLIQGANLLINGSVDLAKKYHLSEIIIGLTIVAFGTSAPELSVSIIGILRGSSNIVVGDILGSNILNVGLILALTGLFMVIPVKKQTLKYNMPICIAVTGLYPVFLLNNWFSRLESVIFLLIFSAVMVFWYKNRHAPMTEKIRKHKYKNWQITLYILAGILFLTLGGEITVQNAVKIAKILKISETTIAVTIVAIGTSLPELVTSLVAVLKKRADLSIGNIIGSNIFNLLLCLGVAGFIRPFTFDLVLNRFTVLSGIYFVAVLYIFILIKKRLSRTGSMVLLGSYIIYIIILLKNGV
ncbi:MAG: calcium/sodium antiporter [Spirochaetes bacterium]|nr:calcium/sodium antiporter [Spirochaetota bacterium]